MRIVFINHDAGAYGATKSLIDLIEGLTLRGVACYVILPKNGPLVKELEKRNVPYKVINYRRWVHHIYPNLLIKSKFFIRHFPDNRIYRVIRNLWAIPRIKAEIQKWNADVIYSNTSVMPVGAITALWMKKPHVWHIREFQWVDQGIASDGGKSGFRWLVNKSAAIIFVSHMLKNYYKSLVDLSKTYVVHNGVASLNEFITLKEQKDSFPQPAEKCYTFCVLGRITPQKGQAEAIKALGNIHSTGVKAKLIIAGRGDYRSLEDLATRLHIKNKVVFIGHTDDPFSIYLQSDACLVCSSQESFGRVTVEAMVVGLPVIGKKSPHSGTQELIQEGSTGLLYEGDEFALAKAMKRLVENPEWGKTLGKNGWEYARKHLNREKYVNQIFDILKKVSNK